MRRKSTVPFTKLPDDLVKSPVLKVLSRAAFVALFRIIEELAAHKGKDNGRLPVTYADFQACGIHLDGIAPALRELRWLGITSFVQGAGGRAAHHAPNLHGVTWLPIDGEEPTCGYRAITTREEAEAIAAAARKGGPKPNGEFTRPSRSAASRSGPKTKDKMPRRSA
jgi:hypothetical protein